MQQRVPNQYKASFLQTLFSPFISVPTRRVLSDKKIQKQKKINLTLTEEPKTKSNQKIKISSSFEAKPTPSTKYRKKTQPNGSEVSNRVEAVKANKGLNFHPRKIIFPNESMGRPKMKSQIVFKFSNSHDKCIPQQLTIDRKKNMCSFDKHSKLGNLDSQWDQKSYSANQKQPYLIAPFLKTATNGKLNPQFNIGNECTTKISTIESNPNFSVSSSAQKTVQSESQPSSDPFFSNPTPIGEQAVTPVVIQAEELVESQTIVDTPKVNRHNLELPKYKTEVSQEQSIEEEVFDVNKNEPHANIFDLAATIQSKYDGSSRKSESDCYSNVLYRVTGEEMGRWRNSERSCFEEAAVNKNQMPVRNTLYSNLMSKFEQQQSLEQLVMNFRKKQSVNEVSKENEFNLTKINDILVIKHPVSPPSFAERPHNHVKKQELSLVPPPNLGTHPRKVRYLGVGRFASVYLCLDSSIDFVFAIKEILKFTVSYNKLETQLQEQIKIQYSCFHPNVVNLYNFWSDQKKYYLALEYGETTLLKIIENSEGGLTEVQILEYLRQILQGLEYLHSRGIVHRDIKPENIIVFNNCCKIGDFGWATTLESDSLNEACGTPCYISPQIENMEPYTSKTDIWSVGILAYELVNGRLKESCFKNGLRFEGMSFSDKISSAFKQMIKQMLAISESMRPTAKQLLKFQILKQE